jgi:hypothetical protein
MRLHVSLSLATGLWLALAGSAPAQPKDPAELMPAQTLAYLELRQPERISREVAALLKGSALENLPETLARLRAARGDRAGFFLDEIFLGGMGMFLSPEIIAEAGRLQGGAVALTGFNRNREPELVGILLAGDSHLPTFVLRMYLTMESRVRIVDRVEGVPLYRERGPVYAAVKPNPNQPPPPPVVQERGPTMALLPGAIVLGSSTDAVKALVRRYKSKTAEPALSSVSAFKENAKVRDRPGLFAYADVPPLVAGVEAALKESPGLLKDLAPWQAVLNPQAFRTFVASLSLDNGDLALQVQMRLAGRQTSPLVELLPQKAAPRDLLHFMPQDGLLTLSMGLTDGEKRWQELVSLLDTLARMEGQPEQALPSKLIAAVEQPLGLRLGKDLWGRIAGLSLSVDLKPVGPGGVPGLPLLAVRAADATAGQALEEMLPRLAGLAGGQVVLTPTIEKVQGITVRSLPGDSLPWKAPLCYARDGATLVLGGSKEAVAAAVTAGTKKQGLLGEARTAEALKGTEAAGLVGVCLLGRGAVEVMKMVPWAPQPMPASKPIRGAAAPPVTGKGPAPEKDIKDLQRAFEPLPPAVLALTRTGDRLMLEARQTRLRAVSAKVITILVETGLYQISARGGGGFRAVEVEAVPVLPPPPPPPGP